MCRINQQLCFLLDPNESRSVSSPHLCTYGSQPERRWWTLIHLFNSCHPYSQFKTSGRYILNDFPYSGIHLRLVYAICIQSSLLHFSCAFRLFTDRQCKLMDRLLYIQDAGMWVGTSAGGSAWGKEGRFYQSLIDLLPRGRSKETAKRDRKKKVGGGTLDMNENEKDRVCFGIRGRV